MEGVLKTDRKTVTFNRRCKNCGEHFQTTSQRKKFCKDRCRWQFNQSSGVPLYVIKAMVKELNSEELRDVILAAFVEFKLIRPEQITREGKFLG
jgi:hypothetical protein